MGVSLSGNFMQQHPQIETPDPQPPERSQFSFALTLAAAAVVIVLAGLYFLPGRQSPLRSTPPEARLPFGPAEQAYAPKIQIENVALSRAENFLHQEVTTLSGDLVNTGSRPLRGAAVTIEFSDELNQVVLREPHSALVPGGAPLAPGERRSFEVSFEHLPTSWNMQRPAIRVTGLQF
jgi:hypothetical protein